jgi:hypothetical protein
MIFTATPITRNQSTSEEFKAVGAEGLAPTVVSHAKLVALPNDKTGLLRRARLMEHFNRYIEIKAIDGQGTCSVLEVCRETSTLKDHC